MLGSKSSTCSLRASATLNQKLSKESSGVFLHFFNHNLIVATLSSVTINPAQLHFSIGSHPLYKSMGSKSIGRFSVDSTLVKASNVLLKRIVQWIYRKTAGHWMGEAFSARCPFKPLAGNSSLPALTHSLITTRSMA
jgi:hypothetical protein